MSAGGFTDALKRVARGETLDGAEAAEAFASLMRGEVSEARIAAFLTALALRKPTVEEITGAVRAMRGAMRSIHAPTNAIDVCGTGGDGLATLNVSTAVSFVVAACGVPVAKHGNRSASSQTGAADVLEALGIRIDLAPEQAEACLAEHNFCFLFAPQYHPAMKHVAAVRRELGFRTIFNLIGPLANPAKVRRQLIGVFSAEWIDTVAAVLRELGADAAWIVHSTDGMDEISLSAPTDVAVLSRGTVERREITPEDAALPRAPAAALRGGDASENAHAIRALLSGTTSPFRDIVLLNAAAALIVAEKARDLKDGANVAAEAIDSGGARNVLAAVAQFSCQASA
ncbi:MAG: anthranilate phosphoribosyltransferase [Alphaproteobacteria bacterium]|nr:anthranilate phosphoribosyltransferase [Alphaproteobacteria bacterium]